jgi:hypothetical protein
MNQAWATRDFTSIGRRDLAKLLDAIEAKNGARQATYCLQVFRAMANWYATRDDHYRSPVVEGMQRGETTRRARILTDDELRSLWKQAETNGA